MNFLHNWALLFVQKCVHKAKQMSYRWCEKMHSTVYLSCSKASRFSVGSNKDKFLKVGSLSFVKSTDHGVFRTWFIKISSNQPSKTADPQWGWIWRTILFVISFGVMNFASLLRKNQSKVFRNHNKVLKESKFTQKLQIVWKFELKPTFWQ